ncbi:MAG: GAF domain-containing protein, partial [Anaerohalosphaera sp.]|nr:GAF domain-containing protein [Anaerohalosphaera sp.]
MPETITKKLTSIQTNFLKKFAEKLDNFGVVAGVFDLSGGIIPGVLSVDREVGIRRLWQYAENVCDETDDSPHRRGENDRIIVCCLNSEGERVCILAVDLSGVENVELRKLHDYCHEHELDFGELSNILKQGNRDFAYVSEMLATAMADFENITRSSRQIEQVSTELAQTYEELVLLYNMSTNMKVTQSNSTYLQIACDQITQMVNVEGIAIFLEKQGQYGSELVLTAGAGVFVMDQMTVDRLQFRLTSALESGKEVLLDSDVDSHFKYEWPDQIRNLIAVPLMGNDHLIGLMVATNIIGKADFDSIETKLFNSVANQCAVFVENGRLFGDL